MAWVTNDQRISRKKKRFRRRRKTNKKAKISIYPRQLSKMEKQTTKTAWPVPCKSIVISIRDHRLLSFYNRIPDWKKNIIHLKGTDGRNLKKKAWIKQNWININEFKKRKGSTPRRGQMGCFDSHVRSWRKVLEVNKTMLILEDDAEIYENPYHASKLEESWKALMSNPSIDILYVYGMRRGNNGTISKDIIRTCKSESLIGYFLTVSGAEKLLKGDLWPIKETIDSYVARMCKKNKVLACRLRYPIAFQYFQGSDTKIC